MQFSSLVPHGHSSSSMVLAAMLLACVTQLVAGAEHGDGSGMGDSPAAPVPLSPTRVAVLLGVVLGSVLAARLGNAKMTPSDLHYNRAKHVSVVVAASVGVLVASALCVVDIARAVGDGPHYNRTQSNSCMWTSSCERMVPTPSWCPGGIVAWNIIAVYLPTVLSLLVMPKPLTGFWGCSGVAFHIFWAGCCAMWRCTGAACCCVAKSCLGVVECLGACSGNTGNTYDRISFSVDGHRRSAQSCGVCCSTSAPGACSCLGATLIGLCGVCFPLFGIVGATVQLAGFTNFVMDYEAHDTQVGTDGAGGLLIFFGWVARQGGCDMSGPDHGLLLLLYIFGFVIISATATFHAKLTEDLFEEKVRPHQDGTNRTRGNAPLVASI
eukprot:COSAG02_NODE_7049_length_3210_cov_2.725169_1_plen_381_part_00